MIHHSVIFKLRHAAGSPEEAAFFEVAKVLVAIPGVRNFKSHRQVSTKNRFEFGFAMDFAGAADYEAYNEHPDHVEFVETRWKAEVTDFLEIDYVPFPLEAI
jgi:hypothetical protein